MDISVIIPVKNEEKHIKRCLDSVFNQSFEGSYEVIVGVDPSEDKSLEIAKEYMKDHPNLIVEARQGKGVHFNRMDSIAKAKGKYICFLDADDYYSKDYLKIMYEEIEKGYDVVNCSFKVDKNNKIRKNPFVKNIEHDSIGACKALLKDTYIRGFLWSKIFKRELFDQKLPIIKASDALFEDIVLVYYIFMHCQKVKSIKTPLYFYCNTASSTTKTAKKYRFEYHLNAFSIIRYLCDLEANKGYLRGFLKTFIRTWSSLWFDGQVSRIVLGHGGLKELRLHKNIIKDLKKKEKLDFAKYPAIKKVILETLN